MKDFLTDEEMAAYESAPDFIPDTEVSRYETPAVQKPKRDFLDKVSGALGAISPGTKAIGESIGTAAVNVGRLFQGRRDLEKVNVPRTIGGYLQAGATAIGAAAPVPKGAGALVRAGKSAAQYGSLAATEGFGRGLAQGENVTTSARRGAVQGVVGAALGGGLSLAGSALSRNTKTFAEDFVAPKATDKVREEAIKQGRLQAPRLFKRAELAPSGREKKLAEVVSDVISPKADLAKNVQAVRSKVDTINNGVKTYIDVNKVPFNANQLRTKLMAAKDESRLIFASEPTAERTYDAVVDELMRNVGKKDTSGLFAARQNFDQIPAIKKLLNSQGLGENVKKEIVLGVRRAANDYIADQLPKGNQYKELLRQESYLLEALGNAAKKGTRIVGKNKLQLLTEEYPILKWLVGGAGVGLVGGAGVGVGGAIIGSTN